MSGLEESFVSYFLMLAPTCEAPVREYRFDKIRRWRFDMAWPEHMVAVELDGGVYSGGRHVRGKGFEGDLEKMNAAMAQGWRVFRFTSGMLRKDPAGVVKMVETELEKVKGI